MMNNENNLFPYNKWGRLRVDVGHPIYECNKKCTCSQECTNRVVQKGRKVGKDAISVDLQNCAQQSALKFRQTLEKKRY